MDITHITSQSLRRILNLTERKDSLVELVAELETEIAKVFSGTVKPPAKNPKATAVRKPRRKPRKLSKSKGAK